jgi:prolyl-tRNA synthetase
MVSILEGIQKALFADALAFRDANTHDATDYGSLKAGLIEEGGFWTGGWCGDEACEQKVSTETSASIRVLPLEREDPGAACAVCGKPGTERATWAKAY